MKAKKLIAIGLVTAITLGMSTSVFADIPYQNYSDEPQFENWDKPFGPDDNAYHAKGQGWLEGGEGINESAVNVLVPTTPNVNIKRGEPGLFDFGFDPQRLVKRTTHAKYAGKETFTTDAEETGVYFINEPEEFGSELNSFDNKSVKYEATNIGTEPLALTVKATLSGGQNFTYLEEEPKAEAVERAASEWFEALYTGSIGIKWKASLAQGANSNIVGFGDAIKGNTIWDVRLTEDEEQQLNTFLNCAFTKPQFTPETGANLIEFGLRDVDTWRYDHSSDSAVRTFTAMFNNRTGMDPSAPIEPSIDGPVGMFLGLNVATGKENGEYSDPTETPFLVADATGQNNDPEPAVIVAAAEFTQVVKGNPDNYALKWDSGTKTYRYMMKPSTGEGARTEAFETVAFWFRGAATYNKTVPADLTVPALDFTWSFSQKLPDAPKLVSVNGTAVTEIPEEFTNDSFVDGKIVLAFDTRISAVDYTDDPASGTWNPIDSQRYSIDGKTLTIKELILEGQPNPKYVRVKFAGRDTTCILKFNNVWS